MLDLFGNHIVGFLMRRLICVYLKWLVTPKKFIALIAAMQTWSVNVDNFVSLVQSVVVIKVPARKSFNIGLKLKLEK